jgi:hypothetical protein
MTDANALHRAYGADALRDAIDNSTARLHDRDRFAPSRVVVDSDSPVGDPPHIQSSADFIRGFVPPDYLLDGIVQRGFLYSVTGRTGSGKTAVLLLLAASVALGRSIGTCTIERGRVLYFAGENPDDIRMRWIALSQEMGFDIDAIDVHFIPGPFKISGLFGRIEREVTALGGVALVVVDTSAAFFEGDDENSNVQAGAHARRFRGLVKLHEKPCVLVACHPIKSAADENLLPRGGGAFLAEVDGNLTCAKNDSTVDLHWQGKFRGPDFVPLTFQLRTVTHEPLKDSKGRLIPTVVAAHLSDLVAAELAATSRTNENRLLAALDGAESASLADLARMLGWFTGDGEPYKMMVSRTLKRLEKDRLVRLDRGTYTVTEKGKKALLRSGHGFVCSEQPVTLGRNGVTTDA